MSPTEAGKTPDVPQVDYRAKFEEASKKVTVLEAEKTKLDNAGKQLAIEYEKLKKQNGEQAKQIGEQAQKIADLQKSAEKQPDVKVVLTSELPLIGTEGTYINHVGIPETAKVIGHGTNSVHLAIQGAHPTDKYKKSNVPVGTKDQIGTFNVD